MKFRDNQLDKFDSEMGTLLSIKNIEISNLKDVLKKIEWAAVRRVGGFTFPACPYCYQGQIECKQAALNAPTWKIFLCGPVSEEYANKKFGYKSDCLIMKSLL